MPKPYKYIHAWHAIVGTSDPAYINPLIELAKIENAPQRAIFRGFQKWSTVDEIVNKELKLRVERYAQENS